MSDYDKDEKVLVDLFAQFTQEHGFTSGFGLALLIVEAMVEDLVERDGKDPRAQSITTNTPSGRLVTFQALTDDDENETNRETTH